MRLHLILFAILASECDCQNILNHPFENATNVVECLREITKMLGRLKMALWHTPDEVSLVSEVLRHLETPVVVNAAERARTQGMEKRVKNDLVIVFGGLSVKQVLEGTLWDSSTRFFLFANNEKRNIQKDFQDFWRFKVINAYEILRLDEEIVVHGFFPYEKGYCEVARPFVVDRYIPDRGVFINGAKAFKSAIRITNMNGCPINITVVDVKPNVMFHDECGCNGTTHIQGIEGNLMNEVAKNFNFNGTFLIALDGIGWGWIHPSPHGAVGEVFTGRSQFAMGLLFPTIERYESLDVSLPYNGEECITFGVPTGAGVSTPDWITILVFEFSTVAWILIAFSFVLIFNVFQIMNKLPLGKWFTSKSDIILYIFSSCLGLPVKVPEYVSLRLSMTCWIIFTFIVTVAYKSSMGSKLTVPTKDPDINTFEELLQAKLQLTGYNNYLRLLQYNDSEPSIQKIVDRFKVTNFDIEYAVDRIAAERKIAHMRHTTTFLYYSLINPKAKGHVHVIKDCINLYHPMIVTKKNSPFSQRLNLIISRLMESGITKRWRSEYIYSVPSPSKPFMKLSKDHMYGVFCILCFGYFLGLLVLLKENVEYYLNKRKTNNNMVSKNNVI